MPIVKRFTIVPKLPDELKPLTELAYNLWWCWNPDAVELFQRIDHDLWDDIHHNPVKMLGMLKPKQLEKLCVDDVFLSHMERVQGSLKEFMGYRTWANRVHGKRLGGTIAYFSMEYGIHECLPIYSGGLGILAGDHLKSASELGLPFTGVGLLYRYGYFRQYLNRDGMQQEAYIANDFFNMPVIMEKDEAGNPLILEVAFPDRTVKARIWRVQVGRIPLILLDTDLDENTPEDRPITHHLYGGDDEMRIRQEIILGIGGYKALKLLGCAPTVCHMNEGHSAFMALERIACLMEEKSVDFQVARQAISSTNVFTTHTPVPAGIDLFPPDLVNQYLSNYQSRLQLSREEILGLGRQNPYDSREPFSMAVLAIKCSSQANGVSKLHGEVSREMWKGLWTDVPTSEVPIRHVTNGIHTRSWFSNEMARLYDRYIGPKWLDDPVDQRSWERVDRIPDSELWRGRERLRSRLVTYARKRLREQLIQRGANRAAADEANLVLDPDALTIGFARRFATYKRANLFMRDLDRLNKILNDKDRPVQLLFAGKAHPKDGPGKDLIRQIIHLAGKPEFRRRIVFLENYDIELARFLVQGVDVWLNNPRRPMEASGTSGMKVPVNGGLNLSILDGWWCEGYDGENGWAIGQGEDYEDHNYQDEVEALALYDLLEREVVPLYYDRDADGLPRHWLKMVKNTLRTLNPVFNTHRMVQEYTEGFYLPALLQWNMLTADNLKEARALSEWKQYITKEWSRIQITSVNSNLTNEVALGESLPVTVNARLQEIKPRDVRVELIHGSLSADGQVKEGESVSLTYTGDDADGTQQFQGTLPCSVSGEHGYSVRILPNHKALIHPFETGLVTWWG